MVGWRPSPLWDLGDIRGTDVMVWTLVVRWVSGSGPCTAMQRQASRGQQHKGRPLLHIYQSDKTLQPLDRLSSITHVSGERVRTGLPLQKCFNMRSSNRIYNLNFGTCIKRSCFSAVRVLPCQLTSHFLTET